MKNKNVIILLAVLLVSTLSFTPFFVNAQHSGVEGVLVTEDTYVMNSFNSTNFDGENYLLARWQSGFVPEANDEAWLKFDLSVLDLPAGTSFIQVDLQVSLYADVSWEGNVMAVTIPEADWSAETLTWLNRPEIERLPESLRTIKGSAGTVVRFDVLEGFEYAWESDKVLTVVLNVTTDYRTFQFKAQELGWDIPFLVVYYTHEDIPFIVHDPYLGVVSFWLFIGTLFVSPLSLVGAIRKRSLNLMWVFVFSAFTCLVALLILLNGG